MGTYVEHGEEGYELSHAGGYLMSAILAGAVDQRPRLGTFAVPGTCEVCGDDLEDDRVRLALDEALDVVAVERLGER